MFLYSKCWRITYIRLRSINNIPLVMNEWTPDLFTNCIYIGSKCCPIHCICYIPVYFDIRNDLICVTGMLCLLCTFVFCYIIIIFLYWGFVLLCVQCIFILSGAHRCMISDINGDAKSIGTNGLTSGICSDVLFFSYAFYLTFSLLCLVKGWLYIYTYVYFILRFRAWQVHLCCMSISLVSSTADEFNMRSRSSFINDLLWSWKIHIPFFSMMNYSCWSTSNNYCCITRLVSIPCIIRKKDM